MECRMTKSIQQRVLPGHYTQSSCLQLNHASAETQVDAILWTPDLGWYFGPSPNANPKE